MLYQVLSNFIYSHTTRLAVLFKPVQLVLPYVSDLLMCKVKLNYSVGYIAFLQV